MLAAVEAVTGRPVARQLVGRRAGDPASVVADPSRIAAALGWSAVRGVDDMVDSAWRGRSPD